MPPVARSRPVVDQLEAILRQRIRERIYAPGARLPSEADLADTLQVSRASLRSALARLAADGLITRRQGDGTFVTPHLDNAAATLSGMLDFWRLVEDSGRRAAIHVLDVERRPATSSEQAALGLAPGDEVITLRRLYTADDAPFIVADNALPAAGLLRYPSPELAGLPIDALLTTCWGQTIAYAVYAIHPGLLDEATAALLARPAGTPLLSLSATFYSVGDRPLIFGRSWYNDAVIDLRFVQTWR